MPYMIRTPNGTAISPHTVRAVRAQRLEVPQTRHDGSKLHAVLTVETRNQLIREYVATMDAARRERDRMVAEVDAFFAAESQRQGARDGELPASLRELVS